MANGGHVIGVRVLYVISFLSRLSVVELVLFSSTILSHS